MAQNKKEKMSLIFDSQKSNLLFFTFLRPVFANYNYSRVVSVARISTCVFSSEISMGTASSVTTIDTPISLLTKINSSFQKNFYMITSKISELAMATINVRKAVLTKQLANKKRGIISVEHLRVFEHFIAMFL